MMDVYVPRGGEEYEFVNCCHDEDYDRFADLDGTRLGRRWQPVEVQRVREDEGREFIRSDFPWLLSRVLVMRQTAVDALRDLLEANGEILRLATKDRVQLFLFNAQSVDALDQTKSKLLRYPSSGRVMSISRPFFVEGALRGVDLFRVPDGASPTYVSERFVERVRSTGLVGLEFEKVWSAR